MKPKDFRPISLQNCTTKICTKGMTMRLQPVITSLVHSDQTGFIKGRCIAENLLYAAEIVQCCHKCNARAIVLKLDFRKAFDSVDWEALDCIMQAKGFPPQWSHWIHLLNVSSQTAVMLNGVPGKWIQCKRGLRQGDLLSPYLFVIVADLLQQMINRASSQQLLQHPLVDDLPCPVLQYADDTIIVLRTVPEQVVYLRTLLDTFAAATGLNINFDKSTFVPIGLQLQDAELLASIMSTMVASFPQTYLGLPLSVHKLHIGQYRPWCKGFYAMCSYLLPQGNVQAIDSKRRAFIWTGDNSCSGGQCKVSWTAVCLDKDRGGLGVKNLSLQNKGLLSKFWARIHQQPTTSWQRWWFLDAMVATLACPPQ